MFTVHFAPGACMGYGRATAQAATLRHAVAFAEEFAPCRCGAITSRWAERGGRAVMEVYDWAMCCGPGPPPVLAVIVAPHGFHEHGPG
jgi:hypothetical protein